MVYSGDAEAQAPSGYVQLNRVDYQIRVGHAKYAEPVHIWDKKSGKLSDFTTHFTFIIDTQGQSIYGDGLVFFLAPVGFEIPPNSAGEFLGVFNTTTTELPQTQIIAVEFDTVVGFGDPPFQHVGINKNSIRSAESTLWNASLHSGNPVDAWVSYEATTQMLSLSCRDKAQNISIGNSNTNLSYSVDLREVLPEWVTIGFSGATGSAVERHILLYWAFNSSLDIEEKSDDNISSKTKLAVGLTVPLGVLLVGGIVACILFQRKPTQKSLDAVALTSINDDLERGAGPKRFSYSDLALATNNFLEDRKLGEGGFGCVYKGFLSREGMVVAIKKISQGSKQGKKEYITEVKIISGLRHRNLVQLIGWCHDQTQFLLVYEFLPNGSLDYRLFSKKSPPLEWVVRYKIVMGLASALLYLHEECEQCVLHRDIKTSNIMLDSGFNAKLGDFGLARLMDHELGPQTTTGLAGTLGYMAPEYATTGKASKESDVYSFGVVVLEIACGRKAMDNVDPQSDLGLVQWVWSLLRKGELLSGVDPMLNNKFDAKQVECLMLVGLWCVHPDRSLRPSILQAIQVLKFEGAVPNLQMAMPVPMYYAPTSDIREVSSAGATMTTASTDLAR